MRGSCPFTAGLFRGRSCRNDERTRPEFSAGNPRALFEASFAVDAFGADTRNYDMADDGRFIAVGATEATQQLNVVINWSTELERLVPRDD